MTVPFEPYRVMRGMPDLIVGLREAVRERNITYQTVDDIGGLPDRYTSKVLAPKPIKRLGYVSIGDVLGALGKALVMVDDPEQIKLVAGRWKARKRPFKVPLSIALSIEPTIQETQQLQRKLRMQELGKKGGKRRLKTMGKRARQRAATHAARMRWSKEKRV